MAQDKSALALFDDPAHDPRSTLDELFRETARYKTSEEYRSLLAFIERFPAYAPYNCFLLHIQNPGARFVASAREWRRSFGRRIKLGARPMVVLIPFGPVAFVYDVHDTEDDALPERMLDPFKATGELPHGVWDYTLANLPRDLVVVAESDMHPGCGGAIAPNVSAGDTVQVRQKVDGRYVHREMRARYRMVLNQNYRRPAKYATLAHELAHLYCGHLGTPDSSPPWRSSWGCVSTN